MKKLKVKMVRLNLTDIPEYALPEGFHLRLFQEGEQTEWARIETAVGEFESETKAMERFNQEFGEHLEKFTKRCVFLENETGKIIGTTTAWYGSLPGSDEIRGRIHWVSLHPEYQGKGLAKPLLTEAMKILQKYHTAAYLTSQTTSYKALNMYRQFGFESVILDEEDALAWAIVEEKLSKN